MLDPCARIRALNAFVVEALDDMMTPDSIYERALRARIKRYARVLEHRRDDDANEDLRSNGSEFLKQRLEEAEYFSDDNADRLKLFKTDSGDRLRAAIADVSKVVGTKAKELGASAAETSMTLGTTTLSRSKELTHSTVERAKRLTEVGRAKLPSRKSRKGPADAEPPAAPAETELKSKDGQADAEPPATRPETEV